MDGSRFDALSRSFSAGHTRRGLSRLLGVAAMGSAVALSGLAGGSAKGKTRKKGKKKARRSVPEIPRLPFCATQPEGNPCGECRICRAGACVAAPDDTACTGGGRCLLGVCQVPPACPALCPFCQVCNAATGQCEACPGTCVYCLTLPDRSTVCVGNRSAVTCGTGACSSVSDCPPSNLCVTSSTDLATGVTTSFACLQGPGRCTQVLPCA